MPPGRTFPLTSEMPLVREMRSPRAHLRPRRHRPQPLRSGPGRRRSSAKPARAPPCTCPCASTSAARRTSSCSPGTKPREAPDESFLVVVERFADQVALALANASAERLHARLEASLLPTAPVDHPRYRSSPATAPASNASVWEVTSWARPSSDDGGSHFVIGDVSGHGPDAAALGATLRSTWKALTLAGESLPKIVERHAPASSWPRGRSPTPSPPSSPDASTSQATSALAGSTPAICPLCSSPDRVTPSTPSPSLRWASARSVDRSLHRFPLPERWSLFCYTDGLIDVRVAPGSPERYGEDRLKERLGAWAGTVPGEAGLDALMNEIETGSGGRFADDVAVLLISTKDALQVGRAVARHSCVRLSSR